MSRTAGSYLLVGGICGLAWSSALRGWMAQLAEGMPHSHSEVTWLTLLLVMLPGTLVGALLAYSTYLQAIGRSVSPWLVLSPALFASALIDPKILAGLFANGTGGGSLIVIGTALAVGYVISHPGWSVARVLLALISAMGLLLILGMGGLAAPPETPRGAWVSLYGFSLVLLLGLASSLPYRSTTRTHDVHRRPSRPEQSESRAHASNNPRRTTSSNIVRIRRNGAT